MLRSAGYLTLPLFKGLEQGQSQGKRTCELRLGEKTGITRIMIEIGLKILIAKGSPQRLSGASVRKEYV